MPSILIRSLLGYGDSKTIVRCFWVGDWLTSSSLLTSLGTVWHGLQAIYFYLMLLSNSFSGMAFAMLIATVTPGAALASVLVPLIILMFTLVSGFLVLQDDIPGRPLYTYARINDEPAGGFSTSTFSTFRVMQILLFSPSLYFSCSVHDLVTFYVHQQVFVRWPYRQRVFRTKLFRLS